MDQAAQALDVDPTSYARWEQGGTALLRAHRKRLSAVIGIDAVVFDQDMSRAWKAVHAKEGTGR